jgi:hypothetical protein
MSDRITSTTLETRLDLLKRMTGNDRLALSNVWRERGRLYKVVELSDTGGEWDRFGHSYHTPRELYAMLGFALDVMYEQRKAGRPIHDWSGAA